MNFNVDGGCAPPLKILTAYPDTAFTFNVPTFNNSSFNVFHNSSERNLDDDVVLPPFATTYHNYSYSATLSRDNYTSDLTKSEERKLRSQNGSSQFADYGSSQFAADMFEDSRNFTFAHRDSRQFAHVSKFFFLQIFKYISFKFFNFQIYFFQIFQFSNIFLSNYYNSF